MINFIQEPFLLEQGDLVVAIIKAQNAVGWSDFSDQNYFGVNIQTKPMSAPESLVVDTVNSNQHQIIVTVPEVTDIELVGGSEVTLYSLEWDNASDGSVYTVLVELTDPTTQSFVISVTELEIGQVYQFKHRI